MGSRNQRTRADGPKAVFDLKISNGVVVTGDGTAGRPGTLAIRDGRIAAMGEAVAGQATREIDAAGHIVCPGFIDIHNHAGPGTVLNFLQQGATTLVTGNCGFSCVDVAEFAQQCADTPLGPNLATLIGHNAVRSAVVGHADRPATPDELERMSELVSKGMADGAVGFSTGLIYVPGIYTATEEIVELAKAAAEHGGYYSTHMRDEADEILEGIEEALRVGRESGLPVQISHLKIRGVPNQGRSTEALDLLARARADGLDVLADQYPYTASCARIGILLPAWAREGDAEQVAERFADAEVVERIRDGIAEYIGHVYGGDASRIVVSLCQDDPALEGKSLAEMAAERQGGSTLADVANAVIEVAKRDPAGRQTMCVYHGMFEEDVVRIMADPHTMIASDGWHIGPTEGAPHPRLYGTFPRVLGRYCREMGLFAVEEAIRKMTSLPARRLGLTDRGVLEEGAWADVVIFDPSEVGDKATFDAPHQFSAGIDTVVVNGTVVMDHGEHTGEHSGVFVKRPV